MADLAFGTSAYSRERGNLPDLPLVNMFVERTPSQELGVVLQSRLGLVEESEVGSGPIRGIFQRDGVLGGVRFVLSGTTLYADGVALGTVSGSGAVSFAASETEVVLAAGGPLYRTDGATLSNPTFPDDANVTAVAFLAGYFIALRAGTQQFYWSAVLNGTSWGALDFASAENEPDHLFDCAVVDDALVLLGTASVEFWPRTGDADIPFAPVQGRVFEVGVFATGCVAVADNSFYWLGGDRILYRNGNVPEAVSDDGIVEKAATTASASVFLVEDERHKFIYCRFDTATMAYDVTTRQWHEVASWSRTNFRGRCAAKGPLFGDDDSGVIWEASGYVDADGVLERRFRAGLPISGGQFTADNLRIIANVGETVNLTGDYAQPVVEMRTSRDGGRTWGIWRSAPLGAQGHYRTRSEWRRLGMFDDPGMLVEFRVTDPVPFRVSGVKVNEAGGGRSR